MAAAPLLAAADGKGGHASGDVAAVRAAATSASQQRASATLVMHIYSSTRANVVNVGDSRAYSFRHYRLAQISSYRPVGAGLIRVGPLSAGGESIHLDRHVVTRALGHRRGGVGGPPILTSRCGGRFLLRANRWSGEAADPTVTSLRGAHADPQEPADVLGDLTGRRCHVDTARSAA